MTEPLDPRVAELLSATLDDAVTAEERQLADQWLAASAAARAEQASLGAVRAAVRRLPAVDPPAGFFERMLRDGPGAGGAVVPLDGRRRRPVALVASAAATAAAWVLVAGDGTSSFRPPVEGVAAAAVGVPAPEADDDAPVDRLGRLELVRSVRARGADEPLAVLGDRGGAEVALLRQEGSVDWAELPHGDRDTLQGVATWVDRTSGPGLALVVVVREGAVYTLASDDFDAEALLAMAVGLPAGDGSHERGGWSRVRRACDSLVDAFTP